MNTCQQCGHQSAGAFCGNCGAPLGAADATNVTAATTAGHHEGWQNEATSTGYVSNVGQPPVAPTPTPYRSAAPYGAAGAAPVGGPSGSGRRSNQMLAGLVALAALAVLALGGYIFLKPKNGNSTATGSSSSAMPSNTLPASTSATPPSGSASATAQQTQALAPETSAAPAPSTSTKVVTETASIAAPAATVQAPAAAAAGSGGLPADVVSSINHNGEEYGVTHNGQSMTVYSASGGQVASFPVRGYGGDIKMVSIAGCTHPVVAYNTDNAGASAVYGWDGSGYQAYKASNSSQLAPIDGAARSTRTYGVTAGSNSVTYRERAGVSVADGNHFSTCTNIGGADVLNWDGH